MFTKKETKTYLDMDGVLARFEQEPQAINRFATEKGFFKSLEPTRLARELKDVKELKNVYILTASPNEQADKDKKDWVKKHIPILQDKVITVRDGKDKAKYAKGGNYLIDDYTENLKFWTGKGGKAIKADNGYNCKTKKYLRYTDLTISVD